MVVPPFRLEVMMDLAVDDNYLCRLRTDAGRSGERCRKRSMKVERMGHARLCSSPMAGAHMAVSKKAGKPLGIT